MGKSFENGGIFMKFHDFAVAMFDYQRASHLNSPSFHVGSD